MGRVPIPFFVKTTKLKQQNMSLITTKDNRIILKKAESVMFVPYMYDDMFRTYRLKISDNVYDISSIVGDTIEIQMEDGDSFSKENEFLSVPLLKVVSGKYVFSAQCIDLQNQVLRSVFGAMTGRFNYNQIQGLAAFQQEQITNNAGDGSMYVLARIRFKDGNLPDVFIPKMELNSKLFVNQLKSKVSQGNINGTALQHKVAVDWGQNNWLCPFNGIFKSTTTYCPNTPLLFVPRDKTPFFYATKYSETQDLYSTINFDTGVIQHNILVTESTGDWAYNTP